MTDLLTAIADTIDELVDPFQHAESVRTWDRNRHPVMTVHRTSQDSLLDQLAQSAMPASASEAEATSAAFASRPPVNLEAVAAHASIAIGTAKWAWNLRADIRDSTASTMRGLVAKAAVVDSDTQADLLKELRHWLRWASIVTHWAKPPWRPPVPCPVPECGKRGGEAGGILVDLTAEAAICTACKASWGNGEDPPLSLLAEYVRTYRATADEAAREARTRAVEDRRRRAGRAA